MSDEEASGDGEQVEPMTQKILMIGDRDGWRPTKPVKVIIESEEWTCDFELQPCDIVITVSGENIMHLKPVTAAINGHLSKNIHYTRKKK